MDTYKTTKPQMNDNLKQNVIEALKLGKNRYRILKLDHSNFETLYYLQFSTRWPWIWNNSKVFTDYTLLEKYALAVLKWGEVDHDKINEVTNHLTKILKNNFDSSSKFYTSFLSTFSNGFVDKTSKNNIEFEVLDYLLINDNFSSIDFNNSIIKIENEFYLLKVCLDYPKGDYIFTYHTLKFDSYEEAKDMLNCINILENFNKQMKNHNNTEFHKISRYLQNRYSMEAFPEIDYEIIKTVVVDGNNIQEMPNNNIDLGKWGLLQCPMEFRETLLKNLYGSKLTECNFSLFVNS